MNRTDHNQDSIKYVSRHIQDNIYEYEFQKF